jgi:hypothetical protein
MSLRKNNEKKNDVYKKRIACKRLDLGYRGSFVWQVGIQSECQPCANVHTRGSKLRDRPVCIVSVRHYNLAQMIFWFFALLMGFEVFIHWFLIEVCQIDVTPDRKFSWATVLLMAFRALLFYIPFVALAPEPYTNLHVIMYLIGTGFLHLLAFGPSLNLTRGKPFGYLGNGWIDSAIKAFTFNHLPGRLFILADIAAGGIYGFYNTHLL